MTKFVTPDRNYTIEFYKKPAIMSNVGYTHIISLIFKNNIGLEIKKVNLTNLDLSIWLDNLIYFVTENQDSNCFIHGINETDYIFQLYKDNDANYSINEFTGTNTKIFFSLLELRFVEQIAPILTFEIDQDSIVELMDILYPLSS